MNVNGFKPSYCDDGEVQYRGPVNFQALRELESIDIDNKIIDILIVKNCDNTPVYLNRTNGKMLKGCIYTMVGVTLIGRLN